MNDYEKRAKDACMAVVENVADAFKARAPEAAELNLHDVLDMAKFAAADREEVNRMVAESISNGVRDAMGKALEKALDE